MKLSERQKEAITYMRKGYELGRRHGFFTNTWLQMGGCGKGGITAKITKSTFESLLKRELITNTTETPFKNPRTYKLTQLGKTIQL